MNKITILLLTIFSVYSHSKDNLENFYDNHGERRMQSQTPQPMRITFDYSEFDNAANGEGLTPFKKQFLKNILENAQIFLSKLIKVYPRTRPIKASNANICGDMNIPKPLQDYGVNNTDLHILLTYYNNSTDGMLATGLWCYRDLNPVIGRIRFNIGVMKIDEKTQTYLDYYQTALHEMMHVLGFTTKSINYWIDSETGKYYGDNPIKIMEKVERWGVQNVTKISSKNILRVAKNHFGCPSINGMYLENQGGPNTMGYHWEKDLVGNEFMTGNIVPGVFSISEFTGALLLDTGYYAEVNFNMLNSLFWGKNKGCDFFNKSCNSDQNFPEFSDADLSEPCDFYNRGISTIDRFDNNTQCKLLVPNRFQFCEDSDTFKPQEKLRQNSGPGSRCFRSNAALKGEQNQPIKARCFKVQCSPDGSIKVNTWADEYVQCQYPNQIIDLSVETKTTQGVMKCPANFDQFCNFPRTCPNNCSGNGVCNNGYCICRGGWVGEDCTKQCPLNYAWNGSQCVANCPTGQFKTIDNLCKSTCQNKQYGDIAKGTCEFCHSNCSACNGPASNQCSACNNGYTLSGSQCVEVKCHESCMSCTGSGQNQCTSCPYGKYLDKNQTCQPCIAPCNSCLNVDQCSTCLNGYKLDYFYGKCNLQGSFRKLTNN